MTVRVRLLELLQAPEGIAGVVPTDVPALLGELESVRIRLIARFLCSQPGASVDWAEGEVPDRLLAPADAAAVLRVTPRWLYRHHRHLPFTRRLSGRALRFSEQGLRHWLEQQGRRRA